MREWGCRYPNWKLRLAVAYNVKKALEPNLLVGSLNLSLHVPSSFMGLQSSTQRTRDLQHSFYSQTWTLKPASKGTLNPETYTMNSSPQPQAFKLQAVAATAPLEPPLEGAAHNLPSGVVANLLAWNPSRALRRLPKATVLP